jgi:hypothetical protein
MPEADPLLAEKNGSGIWLGQLALPFFLVRLLINL